MIHVRITWKVDPRAALDRDCPSEGVLALPEWPHDVDCDECTVMRVVEPPRNPAENFKGAKRPALFQIGEPPVAAPLGPPLLPEAFHALVRAHLEVKPSPETMIDPTPDGHPALPRLIAAARARLATAAGLPLAFGMVGAEPSTLILKHNLEVCARACALPTDAAVPLLAATPEGRGIPREELEERLSKARVRGVGGSDVRDALLAEHEAEQRATARDASAQEAARRYATEKQPIDLRAKDLVVLVLEAPEPPPTARGIFGPETRVFLDREGQPITVEHQAVADRYRVFRSSGLPFRTFEPATGWLLQADGTYPLTAKQVAEAAHPPDELVAALRWQRQQDAEPATYGAHSFQGRSNTPEGTYALRLFEAHAAMLVHNMANAVPHTQEAAFLHHLFLTLLVAYGGAVSTPNGLAALQTALVAYARTSRRTTAYSYTSEGVRVPSEPAESTTWPDGLMRPDQVPGKMLRELANGSAWRFGEALKTPTDGELSAIRQQLDPKLWQTTIEAATAGKDEIRWAAVVDALKSAGLVADGLSTQQRDRVAAILTSLGFEKKTKRGRLLPEKYKAWVREAPAAPAAPAPA